MKKSILCIALLTACTLTACSASTQTSKDANTSATPSNAVKEDKMSEMPTSYTEILDAYSTALKEKLDGGMLMEKGVNLITADLYSATPLDNIGYALMDIDGNGTDELIIGTTDMVTDEFYNKMILELYTLKEDGTRIQVFSSTARDRYFYAGEQLFANLASNSADDNSNTTMRYDGMGLTNTDNVTAPENYMQLDLTAFSLWTPSMTTTSTEDNTSSELVALLDEIDTHTEVGTAGSSLKAVAPTVKLLNWGVSTKMTTDDINNAVLDWMASKGSEELISFSEKMSLIDGTYQTLLGENAEELLSSAGNEDAPYPWSDKPIDTIEVIFDTLGLR